MLPTNGKFERESFQTIPKDPSKPANQYVPTCSGNSGLNYFDPDEKLIYIVVKGPESVEIRMTAVIQVNYILYSLCF